MFKILLMCFALSATAQAEDWVTEAEAYVKTLSRPIDIYTWEPRATFGSEPGEIVQPQDPRAYKFLMDYAAQFKDPKIKLEYEGPNGVYFATDPFASREWGSNQSQTFNGKEWSVVRVTLPQGTRFFDGRVGSGRKESRQVIFKSAMLKFLQGKGCGAVSPRELMDVKSREDKVACWRAYTEMSDKMNLHVFAKFFYAVGPVYCPTHNGFITDFIVTDTRPMAQNLMKDFAVYVPEIPVNDGANEERFFIRDYWLLAKKYLETQRCVGKSPMTDWKQRFYTSDACDFYMTSPNQYALPWSLPESDLNSPVLKQKIESKIYGCGNYREDSP